MENISQEQTYQICFKGLPPSPSQLSFIGIKSGALALAEQELYDVFFLFDKLSLYTAGTVLELPLADQAGLTYMILLVLELQDEPSYLIQMFMPLLSPSPLERGSSMAHAGLECMIFLPIYVVLKLERRVSWCKHAAN